MADLPTHDAYRKKTEDDVIAKQDESDRADSDTKSKLEDDLDDPELVADSKAAGLKSSSPSAAPLPTTKFNYGFKDTGDGSGGNPYYIPSLVYTPQEEARVIRILDYRLFPWILLTTFVLNMDRTNNSNAISDNLPGDLGFTINVVNTAVALNAVCFSVTCITGAIVAKIVGPARCM